MIRKIIFLIFLTSICLGDKSYFFYSVLPFENSENKFHYHQYLIPFLLTTHIAQENNLIERSASDIFKYGLYLRKKSFETTNELIPFKGLSTNEQVKRNILFRLKNDFYLSGTLNTSRDFFQIDMEFSFRKATYSNTYQYTLDNPPKNLLQKIIDDLNSYADLNISPVKNYQFEKNEINQLIKFYPYLYSMKLEEYRKFIYYISKKYFPKKQIRKLLIRLLPEMKKNSIRYKMNFSDEIEKQYKKIVYMNLYNSRNLKSKILLNDIFIRENDEISSSPMLLLVDKYPNHPEILCQEINVIKNNRYKKRHKLMRDRFNYLLKKYPLPEYHLFKAETYYELGKKAHLRNNRKTASLFLKTAYRTYSAALRQFDFYSELMSSYARFCMDRENGIFYKPGIAIDLLNEANRQKPGDAFVLKQLVTAYEMIGYKKTSQRLLKRLNEEFPTIPIIKSEP